MSHGRLSHLGRSDDVIKVGGFKVAPAEIEDVLSAHPAVAGCAVVGVPDGDGLTRLVAFVVRSSAGPPDCESLLRRHLREQLPPQRCPASIEFVRELPRTVTGKTSRHRLRLSAATNMGRSSDG
jgi:acyl-coenzyme A synthetase/AMP-(fatty) acid ligase